MSKRLTSDSLVLPVKAERLRLFGSVDPVQGAKPVRKEDMQDLQNSKMIFFLSCSRWGSVM